MIAYNHQITNNLIEEHKNDWEKISIEYAKLTGLSVEPKLIANSYCKWRKKNGLTAKYNKYDHDVIAELITKYGNDWTLIHKNYCSITKTNVKLNNLQKNHYQRVYYYDKRKHPEVINKPNKKVKLDNLIVNFDKTDKIWSREDFDKLQLRVVTLNDICEEIKEINKFY